MLFPQAILPETIKLLDERQMLAELRELEELAEFFDAVDNRRLVYIFTGQQRHAWRHPGHAKLEKRTLLCVA